MNGETGYSTIHWIKAEIDATLNQARQALESYMEHPEDPEQIRLCAACLQQTRGALQMVDLTGGALLAQEIEGIVGLLAEDEGRRQPHVYELLMRSMLILANYLEWIQGGHDDLPVALLSPINEIRSVRGIEPFEDKVLFSPNLSALPSCLTLSDNPEKLPAPLTRQLRPLYESALVSWLRRQDEYLNLKCMFHAIGQLEQASTRPETARIWWIIGGIIEALLDQGLKPDLPLKQAFGQIDSLIKILGESGVTSH